jgi:hypothetical protein
MSYAVLVLPVKQAAKFCAAPVLLVKVQAIFYVEHPSLLAIESRHLGAFKARLMLLFQLEQNEKTNEFAAIGRELEMLLQARPMARARRCLLQK